MNDLEFDLDPAIRHQDQWSYNASSPTTVSAKNKKTKCKLISIGILCLIVLIIAGVILGVILSMKSKVETISDKKEKVKEDKPKVAPSYEPLSAEGFMMKLKISAHTVAPETQLLRTGSCILHAVYKSDGKYQALNLGDTSSVSLLSGLEIAPSVSNYFDTVTHGGASASYRINNFSVHVIHVRLNPVEKNMLLSNQSLVYVAYANGLLEATKLSEKCLDLILVPFVSKALFDGDVGEQAKFIFGALGQSVETTIQMSPKTSGVLLTKDINLIIEGNKQDAHAFQNQLEHVQADISSSN